MPSSLASIFSLTKPFPNFSFVFFLYKELSTHRLTCMEPRVCLQVKGTTRELFFKTPSVAEQRKTTHILAYLEIGMDGKR